MQQYLDLLNEIIVNGEVRQDRTKTGTLSLFGRQLQFNLNNGFPLLTTKRLHFKSIETELVWFLNGGTNTDWLNMRGVTIWDEWADEDGDLGPIYGKQWTAWPASYGGVIDQVDILIKRLKTNPYSRRHVLSAWNPDALPLDNKSPQENVSLGRMALAPCHVLYQFYVGATDNKLSCSMYMRSSDVFLGLPYNIASTALFTMWLAKICGLELGKIVLSLGDVHLYLNHYQQAMTQLLRKPLYLPTVRICEASYTKGNAMLSVEPFEYNAYPHIKAPIAV